MAIPVFEPEGHQGLSVRTIMFPHPTLPCVRRVQMTVSLEPLSHRWNGSSQRHSCARLSDGGRWTLDACQLSHTNHSVNCTCRGLGTYALALVTQQSSVRGRGRDVGRWEVGGLGGRCHLVRDY